MATKEEREALLKAIEEDGADVLAEADDSLMADREVVLAAVKLDGSTLYYAADSLKADREFIPRALNQTGHGICRR